MEQQSGQLWTPPKTLILNKAAGDQRLAELAAIEAEEAERLAELAAIEAEEAEYEKLQADKAELAKSRRTDQPRTDIKHGICRTCSKRTQLWCPANICTKCLTKAAKALHIDIDAPPTAVLEGEGK